MTDIMKIVFDGIQMDFTPEMIEEVWKEWEAEHPGQVARMAMTSGEFAERFVAKMADSAKAVKLNS